MPISDKEWIEYHKRRADRAFKENARLCGLIDKANVENETLRLAMSGEDSDIPLYKRITNQRKELKNLNRLVKIWYKKENDARPRQD